MVWIDARSGRRPVPVNATEVAIRPRFEWGYVPSDRDAGPPHMGQALGPKLNGAMFTIPADHRCGCLLTSGHRGGVTHPTGRAIAIGRRA